MPNPIQLLPNGGRAPAGRATVYGQVSSSQPLPVTFTDPLFVVVPYDPDHAIRIVNWPAVHGQTLPAAGADVLLVRDDEHNWRAAWWDAVTDMPSSSSLTAGGDASGVLSDLTVGTVLGGQVPITTVTALGGDLSGTPGDAEVKTVLGGKTPVTSNGSAPELVGGLAGPFTVAADTYFAVAHPLGRKPNFVGAFAYGWNGYLAVGTPTATDLEFAANQALSANYLWWFAAG